MSRTIRCGLIQASCPPIESVEKQKEAMIEKHLGLLNEAARKGAKIVCFQELFYGPYFCAEQDARWYKLTEKVPDGPTLRLMQERAKQLGVALVVPVYEEELTGVYYNTAAVIDADGSYLGKYRKTHIPHVKGFWEKFYFRPGNLGYPVFDTAVGKVGVYICYDRHFPEGWRALGLNGAQVVFNPSATSRGLSAYLWKLEQPASAVANEYFIGAINRVGIEPLGDDDLVLVARRLGDDLPARVREVALAVELADLPRALGPDAVDRADEVAVRDRVRRLLELPEVLR